MKASPDLAEVAIQRGRRVDLINTYPEEMLYNAVRTKRRTPGYEPFPFPFQSGNNFIVLKVVKVVHGHCETIRKYGESFKKE